jgi:hypothetical protein
MVPRGIGFRMRLAPHLHRCSRARRKEPGSQKAGKDCQVIWCRRVRHNVESRAINDRCCQLAGRGVPLQLILHRGALLLQNSYLAGQLFGFSGRGLSACNSDAGNPTSVPARASGRSAFQRLSNGAMMLLLPVAPKAFRTLSTVGFSIYGEFVGGAGHV